jgi:ABC-type polysaccharide/polyol phosphate transport system ATPase subunit
MSRPLIEVQAISKAFWLPGVRRNTVREHVFAGLRPSPLRRHLVLDRISFDLRPGEALGLMGSNGCGKSTLLKIVSGIFVPDSGTVTRRAGITPVLELGVGWNGELDAVDNIHLIGSLMGLSLGELRTGLEEILAFAELEAFANLKLKHYSSGMASRLAYAVAFQSVREVLILDEIFAVGDAGFKRRCEDRYQHLRANGHSIILVSHDPRIIGTFCDRAILLEQGRIRMDAPAPQAAEAYLAAMHAARARDANPLACTG